MGNFEYIDQTIYLFTGIAIIGFISAIILVRKTRKDLSSSEQLRSDLAQGEKRILTFLHDLGLSIDKENTPKKLQKIIVEGVCSVTKSKGGALYLIGKNELNLRPTYISKDCAQLVPDSPSESQDKRNRPIKHLSRPKHEGVLGHCLDTNTPFLVNSLKGHPAFQDELIKYSSDGAAMIAPLVHAGKPIGVLAVTKDSVKGAYTLDDLCTFASIAEQSAFAIGNFDAHHQAAEKRRMENELKTAQEVQRVLIPRKAPTIPGFEVYGYNLAAQVISGDYFGYTNVSKNKTGIIIADVSGKGVPAGIIMATFRSALKALAENSPSPSTSLSKLNRLIYPDIKEDMFISAIYCHLDHKKSTVSLARAGHNPAYYYQADTKELHKIKSPGLAVGIDKGEVFSSILKDHEIQMKPDDILLLYTDGIIEANNQEELEFSPAKLTDSLLRGKDLSAEKIAKQILGDISHFVGSAPQSDDITLVVLKKL